MDISAFGQDILKKQPINQLLGTTLEEFTQERTVLSIPITDIVKQQHGFVHGGIIGYLADLALFYAAAAIQGDSVTSEYKINYLRPAMGEKLLARAELVNQGKKQSVCRCEIFSVDLGKERLIALAQGTIVPTTAAHP